MPEYSLACCVHPHVGTVDNFFLFHKANAVFALFCGGNFPPRIRNDGGRCQKCFVDGKQSITLPIGREIASHLRIWYLSNIHTSVIGPLFVRLPIRRGINLFC